MTDAPIAEKRAQTFGKLLAEAAIGPR